MNERDFRIFLAGFACSKEGFNGECLLAELAPFGTELADLVERRDEILRDAKFTAALRQLYSSAFPDGAPPR